jgi:hypothetical protein
MARTRTPRSPRTGLAQGQREQAGAVRERFEQRFANHRTVVLETAKHFTSSRKMSHSASRPRSARS